MEVLGCCIYSSEGFLYILKKTCSGATGSCTIVQCIQRDVCTAEAFLEDKELSLYREHSHPPYKGEIIDVKTKHSGVCRVTRSRTLSTGNIAVNMKGTSFEKKKSDLVSCKPLSIECEKINLKVGNAKRTAKEFNGQSRVPIVSENNSGNSSPVQDDFYIEEAKSSSESETDTAMIENYELKKERASVTPSLEYESDEDNETGNLETNTIVLSEVENNSDEDRDDYDEIEDDYNDDADNDDVDNEYNDEDYMLTVRAPENDFEDTSSSKAELIEGSHQNSFLYLQDGFLYVKNVGKKNMKAYMRCNQRKRYPFCYSRGIMQNGHIRLTKGHNHLPDPIQVDELKLKARCKKRAARELDTKLETIFNEEVSHFQDSTFTFKSSFFGSKRRKPLNPRVPKNMDDFVHLLQENEQRFCNTLSGSAFFSGFITSNEFSIVTFVSPAYNHRLDQVEVVHIDRMFQDVPFLFTHMCSVLIVIDNCVFPLIYAMMTTDTEAAYTILFNFLKQHIPSLNPKMVILDFDQKLMNAINIIYPLAETHGGLFNYSLAVWREIKEKNFITNYMEDKEAQLCTRMLLSLPLLPPEFVELGFSYLRERIQSLLQGRLILQGILDFVHYCWLSRMGIRSFSMIGKPQRASYDVDAYLCKLKYKFGNASSSIWSFLDRLKQFEDTEKKDLQKVAESVGKPGPKRRGKCILTNNKVQELIKKLDERKITVPDFLEGALSFVNPPTKDAFEMYTTTYPQKVLPQFSPLVEVLSAVQVNRDS